MTSLRFALPAVLIVFSGIRPSSAASVQVQGRTLLVEGRPFVVKGMHYGPWRQGTGPDRGYEYPGPQMIEPDLRLIRSLNANTVLVIDPPGYVLDLAYRSGLRVFYSFFVIHIF